MTRVILSMLGMALWLSAASPVMADALAAGGAEATAETSFLQRLWVFVGVFHPMVVHFPIALLTLAAIIEIGRATKLLNISRDATWICLLLGAATAIAAATLGWANASDMGETETLSRHRWIGISVTVLAVGLAGFTTWQRYRPQLTPGRIYLAAMALLAAGVGFTGHLGGQLVYGDDFIERAWANVVEDPATRRVTKPTVTANIAMPNLDDPDAPVDFTEHVWPILQAKCIECHGPENSEGRLRLDSEAHALKGGRGGPAYEPGNPPFSLMIELIDSPFENDRMPPLDEENPVTPDELRILERWIEQGAEWNLPTSEPATP
ncbi:MAG: c-type cytochrome domain-containing protein [Phycisphaeraceae bacterium]